MNLFELENKYLLAKANYYMGTPTMSDLEFDTLEKYLKESNSKVINQVGHKLKDYDFTHPTPMLSLSKIQTESKDGNINYMTESFNKWFLKRKQIIGDSILESSPKFDGNAINTIYKNGKTILTRGDGVGGKNITNKLSNKFPEKLNLIDTILNEDDVVEIRCEVVIDVKLFETKYSDTFSNPRNYVAGVLGADEYNEEKCNELTVVPLHLIINGVQHSISKLKNHLELYKNSYIKEFNSLNYESIIKHYEDLRKKFKFQLDGVVISFPAKYRKTLGENSHDPEWAIAIKFIADEVITKVDDIQWYVGKTGELTPVVQLEPVQLAGTIVRKASGYNYGYINRNKIGKGALVSILKAGDIIPEIQSVIIPSDELFEIPTKCPICDTELKVDDIHLLCVNDKCPGKISKQISSNAKLIDIKNIGPKTFEKFSYDFEDLIDLMIWVKNYGQSKDIEKYGIKHNSRSHEIFLNSFNNIKSLTYPQFIVLLGYNNVGLKLAEQISKMYNDMDPDFTGHDRSLVDFFNSHSVRNNVQRKLTKLVESGINIEIPIKQEKSSDTINVCMTGSPKKFGYATKKVFMDEFGGRINEVTITNKDCQYLITDNYDSKSSKMKNAEKKSIEIITYDDFVTKYK